MTVEGFSTAFEAFQDKYTPFHSYSYDGHRQFGLIKDNGRWVLLSGYEKRKQIMAKCDVEDWIMESLRQTRPKAKFLNGTVVKEYSINRVTDELKRLNEDFEWHSKILCRLVGSKYSETGRAILLNTKGGNNAAEARMGNVLSIDDGLEDLGYEVIE